MLQITIATYILAYEYYKHLRIIFLILQHYSLINFKFFKNLNVYIKDER